MMQPGMGNKPPTDVWLGVDNGCFSKPEKYSDEMYKRYLQKIPPEHTLFVTAPDVLGNHKATVERSVPTLRKLRSWGFKAAFVAQDGWEEETTPWDEFDVLFIGGSTEFKFRNGRDAVGAAKARGFMAHMGRVNSLDRLRASVAIGCDSADGTCLAFGLDKNWPKVKWWLDHLDIQPEMAV